MNPFAIHAPGYFSPDDRRRYGACDGDGAFWASGDGFGSGSDAIFQSWWKKYVGAFRGDGGSTTLPLYS